MTKKDLEARIEELEEELEASNQRAKLMAEATRQRDEAWGLFVNMAGRYYGLKVSEDVMKPLDLQPALAKTIEAARAKISGPAAD